MILLHCKVQQVRRQRGIKQADMAKRCSVSLAALSRMERGLTEPGVLLALRVAEILDCGLRELWPSSEKRKFEQANILKSGEVRVNGGSEAPVATVAQ